MARDYRWLLVGPEHLRDPQPHSSPSQGASDAEEVHLFTRGQESIRIAIHQATKTVRVFGPGRLQKAHGFASDADLEEFLRSYEQQVLDNGWTLLDVGDRRIANRS